MSRTKLFFYNSNYSGSIINDNIRRQLYNEFNKILNDLHHQLFFDPHLTYQNMMVILNNGETIENKLIDVLFHRINQLQIPDDNIRSKLISNIYTFSMEFKPVPANNQDE